MICFYALLMVKVRDGPLTFFRTNSYNEFNEIDLKFTRFCNFFQDYILECCSNYIFIGQVPIGFYL